MTAFKHKEEKGSVAVEAAFVLSFIFLPILLGIIEYGNYFSTSFKVAESARIGARVGAMSSENRVLKAESKAREILEQYAYAKDKTQIVATINDMEDGLSSINLNVTLDYTPIIPTLGILIVPNKIQREDTELNY